MAKKFNSIPSNTKKNISLPSIKPSIEKIVNPIKVKNVIFNNTSINIENDTENKDNCDDTNEISNVKNLLIPPPPVEDAPKKLKRIDAEELKKRREMGQFYTTEPKLLEKVVEFVRNKPKEILEPSVGRGDLILPVMKKFPKAKFDLYEIDNSLEKKVSNINFCNFLETNIDKLYITIVGNPPFVKTKKGNLAIDFVRKCYGLLEKKGELIFIIPADFLKLTSTAGLLEEMMNNGTFTDIYHPSEENLFEYASINVLLFRYCKNPSLPKKCNYNGIMKNILMHNGTIIFLDETVVRYKTFSDYFDIYVGLVSAKDEIYKNSIGNIEVLISKDCKEKFIFPKIYPTHNVAIDEYLLEHKKELLERRIRKFSEDNWFEWGAPRNVETMEKELGKKCIYVHNLTRRDEVAFEGEVGYFGGTLIMMIPRELVDMEKVVEYLNSEEFKKNYIYGGRFKIGHRQLSNALLEIL